MNNKVKERISRAELYTNIAQLMALRATCKRLNVGCVITSEDHRIISTGYNGPLAQDLHCTTCDLSSSCQNAVHAEANAIASAAKHGISLKGANLYVTHSPCPTCTLLIIQSGIKSVTFLEKFRDTKGLDTLIANGITLTQFIKK